MGFVTPARFLERKDVRSVTELLTDNGSVAGVVATTDAKLQIVLDDASGAIVTAVGVGGRYDRPFLEGLTGYNANYLERVTTEIAMLMLKGRRLSGAEAMEKNAKAIQAYLKPFQDGEAVFGTEGDTKGAVEEASRAQTDGPSVEEYRDLNLFPTRAAGKLYPRRHHPRNNRIS